VASTTGTGGGHARGKGQRGRQRRPPIARSPKVERPSGPRPPTAALRGAERATGWGRGDRTFMIAHPQWRCLSFGDLDLMRRGICSVGNCVSFRS
jgi:hypothetical protein